MNRRFLTTIIFSLLALIGAVPLPAYAGFGITPPYLRSNTLTRGSHYTQEIILVRGDPVDDLQTDVSVDVPEIANWITVDRGLHFTFPRGVTQLPIHISVDVPPNAAYKDYHGVIQIRTSSGILPSAGVSIALGAQVDVDLQVVDKVFDFQVHRVQLSDLEEGSSQWWLYFPGRITFTMQIENTGNVPAAPSRVRMDIYDKSGKQLLESDYNSNTMDTIPPFATQDVVAYIPTKLPPGGYLAKYTIYKQDVIAMTGELDLSIMPHGTVPGYVPYGLEGLSMMDKASLGLIALAGVSSIGYPVAYGIRRKRKKKERRTLRSRFAWVSFAWFGRLREKIIGLIPRGGKRLGPAVPTTVRDIVLPPRPAQAPVQVPAPAAPQAAVVVPRVAQSEPPAPPPPAVVVPPAPPAALQPPAERGHILDLSGGRKK